MRKGGTHLRKGGMEMQKHESLLTATDYKKVNHSRLFTADERVVLLLCSVGN